MNQVATQNPDQRLPATSVGFSSANGTKIAPQNLGEIVRFAEVMAQSDVALPQHLRGNPGACMAVAMQALEWQMSPFAVASKSYVVKGAVAYEAQLIAAVVNTRSGIQGRLKYRYDGSGDEMTCTVSGILEGETYEYTSPTIGSITTKNSPLWKSDPQQQLGYFAARSWARRYVPEVLLGVYDREEAQSFQGADNAKNVTPVQTVTDPFGDEPQSVAVEDAEIVTAETETPASAPDTQDTTASDSVTSSASEPEGGEGSVNGSTLDNSEDVKLSSDEQEALKQFIIGCIGASTPAEGYQLDPSIIVNSAKGLDAGGALVSKLARDKAGAITRSFKAVCDGKAHLEAAIDYTCGVIGIDPSEVK